MYVCTHQHVQSRFIKQTMHAAFIVNGNPGERAILSEDEPEIADIAMTAHVFLGDKSER